jgi:hypothetical protein
VDFGQHAEFDQIFGEFTNGDPFRGMDVARLWSFILNLKACLPAVPGALAELGVYKGHSSAVPSHFAARHGVPCIC